MLLPVGEEPATLNALAQYDDQAKSSNRIAEITLCHPVWRLLINVKHNPYKSSHSVNRLNVSPIVITAKGYVSLLNTAVAW